MKKILLSALIFITIACSGNAILRKITDGSEVWYIRSQDDGITVSENMVGIGTTPNSAYRLDINGTLNATLVSASVSGPTTGLHTGNVIGNVTGNVVGDLTGTASTSNYTTTSNYSNDSDKLDAQEGSYYTNASNINAGTLGAAYLPATVITGNISSVHHNQTLAWNGTEWTNTTVGVIGAGVPNTFWLDDTASDIGGYFTLARTPSTSAEIQDSATANSTTTKAIETYATITGGIGSTSIEAGIWEFHNYCYVDSATGISSISANVYSRTAGGVETFLFSCGGDEINNTTVQEIICITTQPAFTISATDRIVVKYVAQTTSVVNRTITLIHNGTNHNSHIITPLVRRHNDLAGLQGGTASNYYHSGQALETSSSPTFVNVTATSFLGTANRALTANYAVTATTATTLSSALISQFTNDSGYITGVTGAVTPNYYGAVTINGQLNFTSVTQTIWIDPVYLSRTNSPSTNVIATTLMECLDFNTTGNIRFQHESPEWDDGTTTVYLAVEYVCGTACTATQTIVYGVSYNILAAGTAITTALTSVTGSITPSLSASVKAPTLYIPLTTSGPNKSVQVHFNRYGGTVGAMQVLNFGLAYHRNKN